jgi:hypothetical protein
MAEETKGDSAVVEDLLNYIIEVMRQNETFLRQNAEETYHEVVELINDAIDYVVLAAKKSGEDYVRYSMISFLNHILMPFSYAIYIDMLAGNIPACFMELRLILESLVKCYLADLEYPDRTFFQERLKLLEDENLSTSELMKDLGRKLGLGNAFVALWSKLSQNWIPTKGIMDGVVAQVIEKSDVPPWGLVLPMHYSESELDTIDELRNNISKFISLLKTTMEKYQKEINLTTAD